MNAVLSDCGTYRYRLERDPRGECRGPTLAWIMVNPSTADATDDDATIRKVIGFTIRAGYSRLIVGNKFAFRATDIRDLRTAADPVGPENNAHLREIMADADALVFAWGPLGKLPQPLRRRALTVERMAREVSRRPLCLGVARDGQPLHPLMQPYSSELREWT